MKIVNGSPEKTTRRLPARAPVGRMLGLPGRSDTHDGDVTFTAGIDLWWLSGLWSQLRSKLRPGSPFASSVLELDEDRVRAGAADVLAVMLLGW